MLQHQFNDLDDRLSKTRKGPKRHQDHRGNSRGARRGSVYGLQAHRQISKLKKVQNITKTAEETAVEIYGEMSMDAKLIKKFVIQQVAVAMTEKTKQYEKK